MVSYDQIGSIAIIKSEGKTKNQIAREAKKLLNRPSTRTVLEKATNVKGRLRTIKTKHLAGDKNLLTIHKENNCQFKLNVETCYFSPRLSNDRKDISKKIKKKDKVLVMFAGVGAYPIIIKKLANPKHITSIEINKACNKYFKENLKLNKISNEDIKIIQGDVKKKINKELGKFDVIVMARPNLKTTFLEQALKASKKSTRIFYYGFCNQDDLKNLKNSLLLEAKQLKRKIKITKVIKAGDIAPYKFRYRIEIKVDR